MSNLLKSRENRKKDDLLQPPTSWNDEWRRRTRGSISLPRALKHIFGHGVPEPYKDFATAPFFQSVLSLMDSLTGRSKDIGQRICMRLASDWVSIDKPIPASHGLFNALHHKTTSKDYAYKVTKRQKRRLQQPRSESRERSLAEQLSALSMLLSQLIDVFSELNDMSALLLELKKESTSYVRPMQNLREDFFASGNVLFALAVSSALSSDGQQAAPNDVGLLEFQKDIQLMDEAVTRFASGVCSCLRDAHEVADDSGQIDTSRHVSERASSRSNRTTASTNLDMAENAALQTDRQEQQRVRGTLLESFANVIVTYPWPLMPEKYLGPSDFYVLHEKRSWCITSKSLNDISVAMKSGAQIHDEFVPAYIERVYRKLIDAAKQRKSDVGVDEKRVKEAFRTLFSRVSRLEESNDPLS